MILEHETGRPPYPSIADDGYCAPYLYLLEEEQWALRAKGRAPTDLQLKKLFGAIDAGLGQGRGEDYRAWLPIRRNFSSPVSHQHFEPVGIHRRNHHFLSKLEFHTALQVAYLCMDELREGLPAWPTDHRHPDDGWGQAIDEGPRWVPGLRHLAAAAGIDHGTYVGTNVPYIASIDLVFRPKLLIKKAWPLLMVSCKPALIYQRSSRARERVALDKLYSQATNSLHVLEDGTGIHRQLVQNLEWMRPLATELHDHAQSQLLRDFCGDFDARADDMGISSSVRWAAQRNKVPALLGFALFRLGCWLHLIDIDLSQPVQMTRPIRRGAAPVIQALSSRYLEAHQ